MRVLQLKEFRDWPTVTQMQVAGLGYQLRSVSLQGPRSLLALYPTLWNTSNPLENREDINSTWDWEVNKASFKTMHKDCCGHVKNHLKLKCVYERECQK